jgi:two-component system response regulator NreC
MTKTKILLVDDHAIMRDGIRALICIHDDLEIVGEASDGKEAVDKALQLNPDLVIMDIAMPKMDGLEATRRIKKKQPRLKILVLTQHDNQEYVLSVIKAGASGYLPKKAVGSELIAAIRAVQKGDSFLYPSAARVLMSNYLQRSDNADPFDSLTAREREVLKLIADGHTSREIAEMLFLSLKTVLGHRNKLMQKLDLHNRTELVRFAIRKGLISQDS